MSIFAKLKINIYFKKSTMRKIFLPIIALLACMLGSCSDEIDYTLSNDCIITGFTLGQVKRKMQTATTALTPSIIPEDTIQ